MRAEFVSLWACHSSGERPGFEFNVLWGKQHRTDISVNSPVCTAVAQWLSVTVDPGSKPDQK